MTKTNSPKEVTTRHNFSGLDVTITNEKDSAGNCMFVVEVVRTGKTKKLDIPVSMIEDIKNAIAACITRQ